MTTEPSNGSASDDQRCYIERLQRIETAAKRLLAFATGDYGPEEDEYGLTGNDLEREYRESLDALKAALEANR